MMTAPITKFTLHIAVVTPPEHFNVMATPDVRQQLETLLAEGIHHLIIDLTAVTFCDSAAIAVLVRALKQARQQNGSVRLVWPQAILARRIFALTKFDQVFTMTNTVAEAMQAFQGES